ncbi:MAG TPA: hypothetical protein VGK73_26235 [Polyangiaceae bacterium]
MLRSQAAWVAGVALLVFAPVLGLGFTYDDDWTITENAWLKAPLGELVGLLASGESLAKRVSNATRPFTVLSFWFDRNLFGGFTPGYHAHSLVLYAVCAAFATILAWQLTRRRSIAGFAGVFFAVAPLHAEPVAGVNYRGELYAGLGVLGVLSCLFSPWQPRSEARFRLENDGWGRALAVALLTLAGLFAKESGVALFLLLALAGVMLPRVRHVMVRRKRSLAALGVAAAVWAFWRLPLLWKGDDLPLAPERGAWQRRLRTARFEVQSVRHALLPWDYNPEYWRQPDASANWLVTLAVIVFAVVVLGRVRATRIPALGVAIALVAPLPSSPLARPINEFADRYFFVGILGGGIFWGWCVTRLGLGLKGRLAELFRKLRRSPIGLGFLCVPLLVPTYRATQLWKDNRTLWSRAVELTPGSARAWLNLSRAQRKSGEHAAATSSLEHAISLVPDWAPALLARVYDDITDKRMEDARAHVAQILAQGLGNARGVRRAVECVKLEAEAAKRCADR